MPEARHFEKMQEILGLTQCASKPTPICKETMAEVEAEDNEEVLTAEEATKYRNAAGIAIYLACDRPDAQFAIRQVARKMAKPTATAMKRLKHLTRYLAGTKEYGILLTNEGDINDVIITTDADWGGDLRTRKSTSCVHVSAGGSLLCSATKGQGAHALSSAEAEFYSAVTGTAEGILLAYVMKFCGSEPKLRLRTDSSAARGMINRQ